MATYAEIRQSAEQIVEKMHAEVKTALASKKLDKYGDAMSKLNIAVQNLNCAICNEEYEKFMASPNPMIAAVLQFYVDVIKVKELRDKETNAITGVKLEVRKARIDLEKLCDFGHLDKRWSYDASQLLALLSLREIDVFKISPAELATRSYYFINGVRRKKAGETPDSNTQIVKLLQAIVDEAIFVDDGTGKNTFRCTNHDIAFIQDAVTKIDTKEKCTIAMLNERQFKTVIMSLFAHCLGEAYKVKGAKIKAVNQVVDSTLVA